jgi:hypothetical protein
MNYAELEDIPAPLLYIPYKEFEVPEEWNLFKAELDSHRADAAETARELAETRSLVDELYDKIACLRLMNEKLEPDPEWYAKFSELIFEYEKSTGLPDLVAKCSELSGKVTALRKILDLPRDPQVCTICMSEQVNEYIDPCGHTFCSECLHRARRIGTCPTCRTRVLNVRKLFFN